MVITAMLVLKTSVAHLSSLGLSKMEPTGVATCCHGHIHLMFQNIFAFLVYRSLLGLSPAFLPFFSLPSKTRAPSLSSFSKHQEFVEHLYCYLLLKVHWFLGFFLIFLKTGILYIKKMKEDKKSAECRLEVRVGFWNQLFWFLGDFIISCLYLSIGYLEIKMCTAVLTGPIHVAAPLSFVLFSIWLLKFIHLWSIWN